MEASRKIFHYPDVTAYGSLSVITTLKIFQHHFSEMGHRDLLVTQIYLSGKATTAPSASRVASAARAALFKRHYGNQTCLFGEHSHCLILSPMTTSTLLSPDLSCRDPLFRLKGLTRSFRRRSIIFGRLLKS